MSEAFEEFVNAAMEDEQKTMDLGVHLSHCTPTNCKYGEGDDCPMRTAAVTPEGNASDRQVAGDHYKRLDPEPWAVMEGWNREHFIGFLRYSALKRIARWDSKDNAIQDVKKAIHELEKCVEVMEAPYGEEVDIDIPAFLRRQAD